MGALRKKAILEFESFRVDSFDQTALLEGASMGGQRKGRIASIEMNDRAAAADTNDARGEKRRHRG